MRAFLLAGTRSLVTALLLVDPSHAGALARGFFTARPRGRGSAGALREAQLGLRDAGVPVESWAAYVLTGGWVEPGSSTAR